jgi:hypothetical protein
MTQPTTDTRAVVRAFDALTTQVQRVADALFPPVPRGYRPVGYVPEPTSSPTDDAPTTGDDGRSRASRFLDAVTHSGPGYDYPAPAADEDALRTARRDSLFVLLSRAYRGTLIPEESELLRHHVEAEIRESNTARAVAAGNVRHIQQLVPEIDRLAEECEQLRTRAGQAEDLLRIAHETSNQSEAERALAVQRAERYESERDAARHRLVFMEENTLPGLHRRAKADRETIGRWRTRARSAEATIGRVRAATTKTLLAGPDAVQVVRLNAIHAALDYSDAEPAELVHPDTEQQVSSPEQVDDIAAVRSAVARTQERCQAVRDREGPGGMINATQVLGLLSPTWPDGNYEVPAPGSTEGP